jgi:iron complex outermembrane recepter protein
MKNCTYCILIMFCITLGAAHGAAIAGAEPNSGSVSGVIAGPDGSVLPGAIITLSQAGSGFKTQTVSSSSGMYRVPDLKAGVYDLAAELIGFETYRAPGLKIESGMNRAVDIALQMATIRLEVTVVGIAPRDSMEASETRESSARDVGEAIAQTPGIFKLRKGGIANDIILRGFSGKDLNVLIDGQRIYGACPNHMDPAAFHVDFAEVDRIEVAKGPFDIKSQGSLGGVVNIVTRKAERGFHAIGNFSAGSYDFLNPSAFASYGRNFFSVLGGYSYRISSPYTDASGRKFTEGVNYRSDSLNSDAFRVGTMWGNISVTPFAGHIAQVSYSHQESDHVLYPYLQMDALYDDTDRINAGYQINDLSGFMKSLRFQGYFTKVNHWMTDEYRTSSLNMLRPYSMGTQARTEALGGKVETMLNTVTVGVEAYHREWDGATRMAGSGYAPQYSIPDVRTDNVGLYSEYARSLTERLKINFGGRLDTVTTASDAAKANTNLYFAYNATRRISTTNNFPSGNARLSYKSPLGFQFSGGVGHTVRVPDARERYFALKRMGTDWVGNPELKPSRNTGFDGGVTFRHQGLLLESNLYLNYVDDYIAVIPKTRVNMVPGVMNTKSRSYQNVNARMYGGEFLVSFLLTPQWFVSSDLSFVRGTRDANPVRGILGSNLSEIPPMRSRTLLRYDTGRIFAEMEGILTGAQDHVDSILGEQRTAGYGIANLKGGIAFKRASLKLGLNNLFGRKYFEHLSYMRDPFRSGARVNEPGRNLFVNVSFRY